MLELRNICRDFKTPQRFIPALRDINITVNPGDYIAVYGNSGSGKSVLGKIISGQLAPSSGQYFWNGYLIPPLKSRDFLKKQVQSIASYSPLLDNLTISENLQLALASRSVARSDRKKISSLLLNQVGLSSLENFPPCRLSRGQRLRFVFARAVACPCSLFVFDEPLQNADAVYSNELFCGFSYLQKAGKAVIIMTDKLNVALNAGSIIHISGGKII